MDGYIIETSALSVYLDSARKKHEGARRTIGALDPLATKFVSVVTLAEITYGLKSAEAFEGRSLPALAGIIRDVRTYGLLDVTKHTANSYAELKANLAKKYLAKAIRRHPPRWLEEWVDQNTGQRLQVDENDLWMCGQAKERNLVLITADSRISRISAADPEVRLLLI